MPASLFGNTVWEGLSTEPKPTYEEGARDGHFFKELDTGESKIRIFGVWEHINLGLAFVKATKSGSTTTDGSGIAEIVFTTPFIDNSYTVALSCDDPGAGPGVIAYKFDRLITGFKIVTRDAVSGMVEAGIPVSWVATRDYDP